MNAQEYLDMAAADPQLRADLEGTDFLTELREIAADCWPAEREQIPAAPSVELPPQEPTPKHDDPVPRGTEEKPN